MTKKPSSRFDDLFSAARSKTEDISPESTTIKETKKSKSRDPDYVRTTIYLPKRLHQQLKVAAVQGNKDMSEIISGLVDAWVQSEKNV
ncbi:MAG: CopG family transcriptional regulator [Crocosphaera sp.]